MTTIQIARTCGIEFECEDIIPQNLERILRWNQNHDASILSDMAINSRTGIVYHKNENISSLLPYSNVVVGTELASEVLDSEAEDFFPLISQLTSILMENGESFRSYRAGIHFHFSLANPSLRMLKSLLRLGRNLEALFFVISGMGYEFRGIYNDSIYTRPITKNGPCCIPYAGNSAQVFNIVDLLASQSIEEFWEKYGDCYNHANLRYNPVRYHWLNLYPMFQRGEYRGTVEFRPFNKTLNPLYIYAACILCKKFVEYAIEFSFKDIKNDGLLKENSIYDKYSKEDIATHLMRFSDVVGIDKEIISILIHIINNSPVPELDEKPVRTHIHRDLNRYWGNENYIPKVFYKVRKPNYTDIHVLRGEN